MLKVVEVKINFTYLFVNINTVLIEGFIFIRVDRSEIS